MNKHSVIASFVLKPKQSIPSANKQIIFAGAEVTEKIAHSKSRARARFFCTSNQIAIIICLFSFIFFPKSVFAETLRISPVIFKIQLVPGQTTTQNITVDNLLDIPLPLKTTIEGFDSSDEENGIKISDSITNSPLIDWIKFDKTDTIIPAKSSTNYTATITVPSEVPLGGYYAVAFFSPITTTPGGSQIESKIGAIFLANIGVTESTNSGEIVNFDFDKNFYQNENPQILLRAKNTSLNFFTAKPSLTIKPFFGKPETIDWEEKTILPGKIRRWDKQLPLDNHYGLYYSITLNLSLENGQIISSKKSFFSFPVLSGLIVITISLLILYSIFRFGRLKKALKLLIKND